MNIDHIPTGITALDEALNGFGPAELTIIAGRAAIGKSYMMIAMIRNIIQNNRCPIALFSLEMSVEALVRRKIPQTDLIHIDDTPQLSIAELRTRCIQLKHEKSIQAIFIDYIQLLNVDNEADKQRTKSQQTELIVKFLKALAEELTLPIIVLSQLGRNIDAEQIRPSLDDFREAAETIKNTADKILFIYRPQYYEITDNKDDSAEIIIAKCADSAVDSVTISFEY